MRGSSASNGWRMRSRRRRAALRAGHCHLAYRWRLRDGAYALVQLLHKLEAGRCVGGQVEGSGFAGGARGSGRPAKDAQVRYRK